MGAALTERVPRTQRTWWHLLGERRRPSEYDVSTSRLFHHVERGLAVDLPLGEWYATHQRGSGLQAEDWEAFRDPLETTYTAYTRRRAESEQAADAFLQAMEQPESRAGWSAGWLDMMEHSWAPLRFPLHGLQMAAAYVGQMAPAGRITIVAALQAADEVRRIQRVAYVTALLARERSGFGSDARQRWQDDPAWQPLRRTVEQLLVTFDWGEALVALNLCLKPWLDQAMLIQFPAAGAPRGEALLRPLLALLHADAEWHQQWATELLRMTLSQRPATRAVVSVWWDRWEPLAEAATRALDPLFALGGGPTEAGWASIGAGRPEAARALGLTLETGEA